MGEYEEAYFKWVASLTPAELEELKRNGLHKPLRDQCMGTPDYERILDIAHDDEPAHDDDDEPETPVTNEGERLALILLHLADAPNPRLEIFCLMWLFGFVTMLGLTQEQLGAKFGLSRAAISRRIKNLQRLATKSVLAAISPSKKRPLIAGFLHRVS